MSIFDKKPPTHELTPHRKELERMLENAITIRKSLYEKKLHEESSRLGHVVSGLRFAIRGLKKEEERSSDDHTT